MELSKTDVIIQNATVSYLAAFEPKETPSGDMKYSVSILFPKEDKKQEANVREAIAAAVEKGLANNKFTKMQKRSLRLPIRDGSAEHESGDRGVEYDGQWFVNANSNNQPGILQMVNGTPTPIMDPSVLYSGCVCHVHVGFFPYNTAGNRGIGAGFQNILLISEGERLDGRVSAENAFSDFASETGETENGEKDVPF